MADALFAPERHFFYGGGGALSVTLHVQREMIGAAEAAVAMAALERLRAGVLAVVAR